MNIEKWIDIKGRIKEKFEILDEQEVEEEIGQDQHNQIVKAKKEIIEFQGPLGKIKLVFSQHPPLLEKKADYSRRIGGQIDVKYIYDIQQPHVASFSVYQWDEGQQDWQELKIQEEMFVF
ncbi:MAG: hypothetical protein PHS07_01940 [Patescibacteria group bacterium]|jgi:hypothetical protein|nr:hypothetical protein [Patescibacteria group bacterium]